MSRMGSFPDNGQANSDLKARSELDSIQKQLDDLRDRLLAHPNDDAVNAATLGELAREILRSRKRRAAVFGQADLFAEPAWDILLGLYVAAEAQQRLTVSAVCEVSGVPQTTAIRWLEKLERDGWASRHPDPLDRRRFWIQLTERASSSVRTYLGGIRLRPDPD